MSKTKAKRTAFRRKAPKRTPRPGDYIRVYFSYHPAGYGTRSLSSKKYLVLQVLADRGFIRYATPDFAWVPLSDCVYAGRASDKAYFKALESSDN